MKADDMLDRPIATTDQGQQILEDIRRIEFQEIHYGLEDKSYFHFIRGSIPILISAPHGAIHFRTKENRWKGEDEYTSSLAIELGRLTGAHVIYVKSRAWEDPNQDENTEYKVFIRKTVEEYGIKFIMDLHGADRSSPFRVDVGTIDSRPSDCSCPCFRDIIQEAFSGFEDQMFNQKFRAACAGTVTSFAWRTLGVEAAQMEINADYRIVERKPDSSKARALKDPGFRAEGRNVLDLVSRMERMIRGIHRTIEDLPF